MTLVLHELRRPWLLLLLLLRCAPASTFCLVCAPRCTGVRHTHVYMVEPPFPHPFYDAQKLQKAYSDYVWDPDYPGTLPPGTRKEKYDLDEVLEMWDGKENPNVFEYSQDELVHIPLKPPEDILTWLDRRGLLDREDDEAEEAEVGGDTLLDEEFDLEESDEASGEGFAAETPLLDAKEQGATMSDFL